MLQLGGGLIFGRIGDDYAAGSAGDRWRAWLECTVAEVTLAFFVRPTVEAPLRGTLLSALLSRRIRGLQE